MQEASHKINKPQLIWAFVLAFGLSFANVAGWLYETTSFLSFTSVSLLFLIALFVALTVPFYFLLVRLTCGQRLSESAREWQPAKVHICIAVLLMVVPQFILWLIAWPGIYHHDGAFHILQMTSSPDDYVPIQNWHSVLYTLFLGGIVRIAKSLGSADVGFSIAMLIQSAVLIYAQMKASLYIGRQTCSKAFFWITVIFFGLHPFACMLRISSCQDVLFDAFLLLALIEAFEIGQLVCSGQQILTKNAMKLLIYVVLMCLFRNNGIYFYAFAVLFTLPLVFKKKLFKSAGFLILPILITLIITGPVFSVCGVVNTGNKLQEMMSIPSQQIARSLANNPNSFSEEDKEALSRFYPRMMKDSMRYWNESEIADWSRRTMGQDAVKEDLSGFVNFYMRIGAKNLGNYRDAFLINTLGWWYPFKVYPDSRMWHGYMYYKNVTNYIQYTDVTYIDRHSVAPVVDGAIEQMTEDCAWNKIPVVSLFFNTGAYTWILIMLCVVAILKKRKSALFPLLIVVGMVLTYLLASVCYFRYSYSMIVCIPLLVLVCFKQKGESKLRNVLHALP